MYQHPGYTALSSAMNMEAERSWSLFFYVLLTVRLSIILAIDQFNAQIFVL
jgi:hypothetical protein